jgi:pilus assembly protein CpaF
MIEILRDNIPIHWVPLEDKTFTIGRHPASDILLDAEGVATEQAKLVKSPQRLMLFNLAGDELTVNDRRVQSTLLDMEDIIKIKNYKIRFREGQAGAADDISALKIAIHQELIERLDLKKVHIDELGDRELWRKCETIVDNILARMNLPATVDVPTLKKEILNEALALGPLEALLADESITEIMVNNKDNIFVERKGKLTRMPSSFTSNDQVVNIISRIVNPLGRRIDESAPMVDARLKDGSRVNAIIPPLSLHGPMITIRKFAKEKLTTNDLIRFGSVKQEIVDFLQVCVVIRKNMVISGGTGSGKTSLLNVLSSFIPSGERVVTIEDSAELQLPHENLGSLEARPTNIEGKGEVTIRDLVRNALRMRPDRIIVGECRSGESLDMLQAMNTGHDGSLTTLHANNTRDAILRLETMVMMAGFDLPVVVIRRQIGSAINVIVQQSRMSDGTRKISCISEVLGVEGDEVSMQDIFEYRRTGTGPNGEIMGEFMATGYVPSFVPDIAAMGIKLSPDIFQKDRILQ